MMFSRTVEADKLVSQRGFTLIELSIVLAIIGLLVGGVLKGQEMINGARLKTTVAQVNTFRAAVTAFQDKYNALPGDYNRAAETISNVLVNGNGNGSIGAAAGNAWATWTNNNTNREEALFWQHLTGGQFMSGSSPTPNAALVSVSFPAGNVTGSGWKLLHANAATFPNSGNYFFVLGTAANGGVVLAGRDAAIIDLKYDDNLSSTGSIVTSDGANCTDGVSAYLPLATLIGCRLGFVMQ